MRRCPYCGETTAPQPNVCPHCGQAFPELPPWAILGMSFSPGLFWGFEYRSPQVLMGLPLIHVAFGINPETGLPRVAKGILAIGNFAVGVIAVGGFALGGFVLSGIGLGLLTLGGIALGAIAVGGIALSVLFSVGGLAVSLVFAVGGLPIAPQTLGPAGLDCDIPATFTRLRTAIFAFVAGLPRWRRLPLSCQVP